MRLPPFILPLLAASVAWWAIALPATGAQPATYLAFEHVDLGQPKEVQVLMSGDHIRVDRPRDRYAVIYRDRGEEFTGLELRDSKFWRFRWPEVKEAVAETERNKQKLGGMDWGDGFASYDLEQPWQKAQTLPRATYQWTQGPETGRRLDLPVSKWIGVSETGQQIVVWATRQGDGRLSGQLERLHRMNEPLELAAVRGVLPKEYFIAARDLAPQGWVPLDVLIGSGPEKGRERVFLKTVSDTQLEAARLAPPPEFRESPLLALEGIFQEAPDPNQKDEPQSIFDRGEIRPAVPSPR